MQPQENNYAFIDGQNLHLALRDLGWALDLRRFRVYLKEKYGVTLAFWFIGYVQGNSNLYRSLQTKGYIVIFKPTLEIKKGGKTVIKGNVDAELVLHTMIEYPNYHKTVIITGDGDFHCLVEYLIGKDKLKKLLIPDQARYSVLLKRFPSQFLAFISDLRFKLEYQKKRTP